MTVLNYVSCQKIPLKQNAFFVTLEPPTVIDTKIYKSSIGESVVMNFDHVGHDKQSHHGLDIIECP